MMRQLSILLMCSLLAGLGVACSDVSSTAIASPALTATPNEVLVTIDATRKALELPPTWTPTDTPTITPTPTVTPTLTVTPSATPIDPDLLCEGFRYDISEIDGLTFGADDTIRITYGIDSSYAYAFVGVVLEHDDLEDVVGDVVPGGSDYTSTFVARDFPLAGEWHYRTGVFLINGDEMLCRHAGTFTIAEDAIGGEDDPARLVIPTALPVPSVTPQARMTMTPCWTTCLNR